MCCSIPGLTDSPLEWQRSLTRSVSTSQLTSLKTLERLSEHGKLWTDREIDEQIRHIKNKKGS
jgi:hypothetical protein